MACRLGMRSLSNRIKLESVAGRLLPLQTGVLNRLTPVIQSLDLLAEALVNALLKKSSNSTAYLVLHRSTGSNVAQKQNTSE